MAQTTRAGRDARNDRIKHYALIVVGCVLGAMAYPMFLAPSHIAPGGVTGVATVLRFAFGWPIGITSLLLNIPLFFIGFRAMGRRFVIRTLVATVLFSLMIDLLKLKPFTMDPLLASLFGGVLLGVGLGLILRGGATTGGTDLLARVVHNKYSVVTVGGFLFAIDFLVILLAGFTMSAEHALYALICVFATSKVLDTVLAGLGTDKACHIISSRPEAIADRLKKELDRGVTILPAVGSYSGNKLNMLICVVGRLETIKAKQIVEAEDPFAFMYLTDTHETLGEGFRKLSGEDQ